MADTYLTRQTLLKRMKSMSDDLAWEEFVQYYKDFIYSIIIKMRVSEGESDDIAQNVTLKIWKSLDQFDHNQRKGHFRSWLHAITKNTVLSYMTKTQRAENRKEAIKVGDDQYDEPEIDRIITEEWESHISALAFEAVKERVSSQSMDAFLSGFRDEPVNETAKRLNVSEDMVYTYRSRVKMKLMAEIQNLREMLE